VLSTCLWMLPIGQYESKWTEEVLSGFKPEDLKALNTVKQFSADGMNILNLILESGILTSIPEFIGYIERLDLLDFYYFLLNEEVEKLKIYKAFTDKKERYSIKEKVKWEVQERELMDFFEFPEKIRKDTVNTYKRVYTNDFMAKLERYKGKMEAGIRYVESLIGKDNVESILEKISGRPRKLFSGFREYYQAMAICHIGQKVNRFIAFGNPYFIIRVHKCRSFHCILAKNFKSTFCQYTNRRCLGCKYIGISGACLFSSS
jgi:hypothetical protein